MTMYTKFIILGLPRSGSNMLLSCLKKHPQIICFNEIFNSKILWGYHELDNKSQNTKALLDYRNKYPLLFLNNYIFPEHLDGVHAVGFKLFYYQLEQGRLEKVWDYIFENYDIKIIHIYRKNILKQVASYRIAQETQEWLSSKQRDTGNKVVLDVNYCINLFEKWSCYYEKYKKDLSNHDVFHVSYENLSKNTQSILKEAQKFLGVDIRHLLPSTVKQRRKKLNEVIINYDELKNHFKDTRWERYFAM